MNLEKITLALSMLYAAEHMTAFGQQIFDAQINNHFNFPFE